MEQLSADLLRARLYNTGTGKSEIMAVLPERVLQFGTGVLLRALPDYFIDKANHTGIFNGSILVVKTTGDAIDSAFIKQNNLYTVAVRGYENGVEYVENRINESISRVLHASQSWPLILAAVHNKNLGIIISDTTEKGIRYQAESILANPPESFPGKLLALLFERFNAFGGTIDSGMVILPTELIPDNGSQLKAIVMQLSIENKLGDLFIGWLSYHNTFCNTLVDRMVPGKPSEIQAAELENELGYKDDLLCLAEPYCLWAIEGGKDVAAKLSFQLSDQRMVISPNIALFRELKLRLLNGTHSLSCGAAVLAGIETVSDAVADPLFAGFIKKLIIDELSPAIPFHIDQEIILKFGLQVLDRFRNTAVSHYWLKICTDYTRKLRIRVVPVLLESFKLNLPIPAAISLGFAAYIVFMNSRLDQGIYWGKTAFAEYQLEDEFSGLMHTLWQETSVDMLASSVLSNIQLWNVNLNELPCFSQTVQTYLNLIKDHGIVAAISKSLS